MHSSCRVELIGTISAVSSAFLPALNALRELHLEVADLVEAVKTWRNDLVSLDDNMVTTSLELLQKQQTYHNLQQMQDTI